MKILALDTATEACSAALYLDGDIRQLYRIAPREHSHIILPMIDRLLTESGNGVSDLDALAFGRGPGSFMGVRIAAGVAQGIAFAEDLPVVPISTLAAIAQTAHAETGASRVLSSIDARMNEVYWGAYSLSDHDCMRCVGEERVCAPTQVPEPEGGGWTGAGSGWKAYSDELRVAVKPDRLVGQLDHCFPTAESIVKLAVVAYAQGDHLPAAQAQPVYLRDKVAKKPPRPR